MSPLLYSTTKEGRAVATLALAVVLSQGPAMANPLQPVVTKGSASFSTQGPQLTIHTGNNALINWSSFNIGANETTTFVQPSANSVVWNHVSDPNPTQILGHLDANGYVVLQNQSGFFVGGNAVIDAHGLVMTTTPSIPANIFGGGSWDFTAPPPMASIINYGEINAGPAGSVFLISHDIENHGAITAPGGSIGLCAGENVLMSSRADGRGVSAAVTLPQGSVDNSGKLIADAGTIALNAQVVNQGGLVQANSVRNQNGVIEIVASDSMNLGAGSTISAKGDTQGASAGGQVTIKSGQTYSDTATSVIDVSGGAQGGNGGKVEISATELAAIQSQVNGHANEGWVGGNMTIDPVNITLTTGGTTATSGTVNEGDPPTTLVLNPNSLNSFSQIDLQASQNITLASAWTVPDFASAATLTLQAGNNIVFAANGDNLTVGKNWTVNLIAGASFTSLTGVTANTKAASGSIIMNGNVGVQSANGNINLIAGGEIVTGTGPIVTTGGGSILMQAYGQNLVLNGTQWNLPDSATPASLTLQSVNNIVFGATAGDQITLGHDWSVNMVAGANFNTTPVGVAGNSTTGASSIVMTGATGVQSANGNINLVAGGNIVTGTSPIVSTGGGSILMQAIAQNVVVSGKQWNLPDSPNPASLTLQAGNNIVFGNSDLVTLGQNWSVDMVAGANFTAPTSVTPNAKAGASSIVMNGSTGVQTVNGSISLIAGGNVVTGTSPIVSTGGGSILMQAAAGNVVVSGTQWNLPDSAAPVSLTLQAGNNVIFANSDIITLGQNWSVNMVAGATFATPTSVVANPLSADNSIVMNGTTGIQTANGNIDLIAGNAIAMTKGTINSTDGGSITMQSISPTQSIALGATQWNLPDSATPNSVTLEAGGNITLGAGIEAGVNWALNLVAGATFATPTSVNTKNIGSVTVGGGVLQTQNGSIAVNAGGGVTVGSGSIHTLAGGSINVDAVGGSVNAGNNPNGYTFRTGGDSINLGGISTAAGGNVTITAGGDVTSFLPTGTTTSPTDAGSGAFGTEPGVVTITAGGNVYGHYVVSDSVVNGLAVPSTITALNGNAGSTISASDYLALSLVTGSWVVNAPHGSINLQEVRNPNGTLNAFGIGAAAAQNNVFNYAPDDSVTLNAGNAVNLLGLALPRFTGYGVPCIYPPSLTINAGPGGVTLGNSSGSGSGVILFPSPDGELTVNTTVPANTPPNPAGSPPPGSFVGNGYTLAMSDSGATRWIGAGATGTTDFANDHAATPVQLNSTQPVVFNIAGDLDDVTLISPKATQVTVGGSMNNVSFTGQNLQSTGPMSTTFFKVAGQIFEQNTYAFETLSTPLALPPPLFPNAVPDYLQLLENAVVPGSGPSSPSAGVLFPSLNIFYLPGTHQLGYDGIMTASTEALLLGPLQEKTYTAAGKVLLDAEGNYITTTFNFAANSGSTQPLYQAIQALYAASQNSVNLVNAPQGIVIGGPGQLNITAQSMDLGVAAEGVSSVGPAINHALAKIPGKGAAINITLTGTPTAGDPTAGNLDLFASQISSWNGGAIDINVGGAVNDGLANLPFQQPNVPHGIWTSGDSDVSVIAQRDINIEGSRIATFNGGNINVESLSGNVNAGTGSLGAVLVNEVLVDPKTGAVTTPQQPIAGSGILATTLPGAPRNLVVGNITVDTPQGNITAGLGGITQEPRNGNTSLMPTVNLNSGSAGHPGSIDAGDTGVIAINVNAQATGGITGLFISSGNTTIHSDTSIDATVLAGGTASLSASTTVSGLAIAGGGVSIGSGSFQGVALSQNVSGGGAQSALASAASAGAGSQTAAAAGEASSQKASTSDLSNSSDENDDLKQARKRPLLAKYVGRVTVILPPKL